MTRRTELGLVAAAVTGVVLFLGSFVVGLVSDGPVAPPSAVGADSAAAAGPGGAPLRPARGRLEVLNAGGSAGAARRATERLRSGGFDVVYYGNAAAPVARSAVVARVPDGQGVARAAADRLGIEAVESRPDSTLLLDATVLVGPDWPPPQVAAPPPSWLDRVRALFR